MLACDLRNIVDCMVQKKITVPLSIESILRFLDAEQLSEFAVPATSNSSLSGNASLQILAGPFHTKVPVWYTSRSIRIPRERTLNTFLEIASV